MIDWSACWTQCQKSLPIQAASRSLPEWHRSLFQPGFPWQTSKARGTQAPVPAEATFPPMPVKMVARPSWLALTSACPPPPGSPTLPRGRWHAGMAEELGGGGDQGPSWGFLGMPACRHRNEEFRRCRGTPFSSFCGNYGIKKYG